MKAKAVDKLETVEDFEEAFNGLLENYQTWIKKVGAIVARAKDVLSETKMDLLRERLKDRGWHSDLLEAARRVHEGTLEAELVVSGVAVKKVMTLTELDRKRLLSNEEFPLKQESGPPISKRWTDMDADEINQLLGPKGGYIHTPREQKVSKEAEKQVKYTNYTEARFDRHENKLRFSYGRKQGEIVIGTLIQSLLAKGELADFYTSLKAKMTEVQGDEAAA